MGQFENDLKDLCMLNLLEEAVMESTSPDAKDMLKVIDWRKQNLTNRLIQDQG